MTDRPEDGLRPEEQTVADEEARHPTRRAVLKAAWTVPVVVSLGSLDFGTLRGATTSSVSGGGVTTGGGDEIGTLGSDELGDTGGEDREMGGLGGSWGGGGSSWW